MCRQPPAAPPGQRKPDQQKHQPHPSQPHPPAWSNPAVLHVFRKCHPLHLGRIQHSARPATILKPLHPGPFFQSQYAQIASNKAPSEDSAGQVSQIPRFQRSNMLRRHLRGIADGLDGDSACLARPSQLFPECCHSALLSHVSWPVPDPYDKRSHVPNQRNLTNYPTPRTCIVHLLVRIPVPAGRAIIALLPCYTEGKVACPNLLQNAPASTATAPLPQFHAYPGNSLEERRCGALSERVRRLPPQWHSIAPRLL
jgi:hypothetical protein